MLLRELRALPSMSHRAAIVPRPRVHGDAAAQYQRLQRLAIVVIVVIVIPIVVAIVGRIADRCLVVIVAGARATRHTGASGRIPMSARSDPAEAIAHAGGIRRFWPG